MALEITFFGGAGDYEKGELGGVQGLFNDLEKQTKFLFECGQRPDHTNKYYGFPYKPKAFQYLALSEFLDLFPKIKGIYRHDYEYHRRNKVGNLPLKGIIISHAHYDHIGGLTLIRHDMPIYMHPLAQMIAWIWQYTSGKTTNQFIDLYEQFSLNANISGGQKFASGDEAILPRDIHLFQENKPFNVGNIEITPHLVDHSLPGSCGFIFDTSAGKIGLSGDIRKRGRRPEDTTHFVESLLEQKISYLFWEGSLLHFDHYGTEDDVSEVVSALLKKSNFAAIAYPPRDLDRITSLYNAAKANKRMLVVSPAQALTLMLFNGVNGFPKMNQKYIGVYLPKKRRGLIDREDFSQKMIEGDYFKWEEKFLKWKRWKNYNPELDKFGHESSKTQRVSLNDLRDNPDQFLVYMPSNYMAYMLEEIKPKKNSIYIRSHPAPWTADMEIGEQQQIEILRRANMYDGPQPDYLTPSLERKMHQVHITGHLNRKETREILRKFNCPIIPYHCMYPQDFVEDVAQHTKVIIPGRGEKLVLK